MSLIQPHRLPEAPDVLTEQVEVEVVLLHVEVVRRPRRVVLDDVLHTLAVVGRCERRAGVEAAYYSLTGSDRAAPCVVVAEHVKLEPVRELIGYPHSQFCPGLIIATGSREGSARGDGLNDRHLIRYVIDEPGRLLEGVTVS